MSNTIDNRVVQMEFENKNFESNANTSISTLDKLKQALKLDGSDSSLSKAEKALGRLDLTSLSSGIGAVSDRFSTLGIIGMTAIQNITNKVVDLGMHLANDLVIAPVSQGFQEYELKMGSIQTIMASTGASIGTVNGYLEDLNKYSDQTIYSFSDMTSSIGKFTNAGVELNDAVLAIKGISNEAAVSGANAQEASRAMYNFSQALSAGYVKLIDWKSIENANMATKEFKQELINTAVELGYIEKQADGYYKVLTENAKGDTMDDVISATKNFNDSLSYQWMKTDVLTKTLGRYADANTEIGKKAFEAATKVKTFTQLMDTLKEAVGSGWSKTFELFIGDFVQARELFTSISNVVGGFIDQQSNARNSFLEAVLGGGTQEFEATADGLREETQLLKRRNSAMDSSALTIDKLRVSYDNLNGRDLIIKSLANTFKYLGSIINTVKLGFDEVFEPLKETTVYKALGDFYNFTKTLHLTEEQTTNLTNTFSGFFSVVDMVKEVLVAIGRVVAPVIEKFGGYADKVITVTGAMGHFVKVLADAADQGDWFYKIFSSIADFISDKLSGAGKVIGEFTDRFNEMFGTNIHIPSLKEITDFFANLETKVPNLEKYFTGAINKVKEFGSNAVKEFEKITGIKIKLPTMDQVFDVIGKIKTNAEKLFGFLKEQLDAIKATGIFDNLDGKLSGAVTKVKEFASGFKKEFERVTGIKLKLPSMDQIIDVLGKVRSKIGDVVGFLKSAFEGIKNTGIFDWIADKFSAIKDAIASVLNPGSGSGDGSSTLSGVSDALGKLPDVFGAIGKYAPGAIDGIKGLFKQFSPNFSSVLKGVTDAFTGMKDNLSGSGSKIAKFFTDVGEGLGAFLSTVSFDKIADLVKTGLLLYFGIQVISFVKSLKKAADNVADVGDVLSKGIGGIFGKKEVDTSFSTQFLKVAAGLAIIALAIVDLSKLPIPSILKGGAALIAVIGVVSGVMVVLDKVAKLDGKNAAGIGTGFLALSAAMLILAGAVVVWSKIPIAMMIDSLGPLVIFIAALGAVMKNFSVDGKNIAATAASFIVLSIAMITLAGAMLVFSKIPIATMIDSLGPLLIFIAALGAVMNNFGADGKNIAIMSVGLLTLSAAMIVLAGACLLFSQFSLTQLIDGLGPMIIFIGVLGAVIQTFPSDKILGVAGGMLALSVSMIALTASLMALSLMNPEHLGVALIALAGGLLAMAAAAAIVSGVTAGATAMLVMAGAVLALTIALNALSNVGLGQLVMLLGVLAIAVGALAAACFLLAPASVSLVGVGVGFAGVGVGAYFLTEALLNLGDIIRGLVGTINDVLGWIVDKVGGVIDWAKGAIDGVAGVLQALGIIGKDSGEQLTQNLTSSIESGTPDILSAAQTAGDQTMSTLNQSLEAGGANTASTVSAIGLTDIIDPLCGALSTGTTSVGQSTDALMNSMLGTMGGFEGDFSLTGTGLMDSFNSSILEGGGVVDLSALGISEDMLANLTVDGSSTGYDDILTFVNGVESGKGDVTSAASGITNTLSTGLVKDCSKQGSGSIDTYNAAILSKKAAAKSAANTVANQSVSGLQSGSSGASGAGSTAGSRYNSGILGQKSGAYSAGSSLASSGASGASSQSGGFYNAGSNSGGGFISGLKSALSGAMSAASTWASNVLSAVKSRLGINSPSYEFAKLGDGSVEGFVLGLRRSTIDAENASRRLADDSINSMKHALGKVAASVTDDIDLTPTISPVLDLSQIQNGSKKIQGMLGQQDVTLNPTGMTRNNLNGISTSMNGSGFDVVTAINELRTDVSKLSAAISADRDRDMVLYTNIHTTMDGREIASTLTDSVVRRINRSQVAKLKAVGA